MPKNAENASQNPKMNREYRSSYQVLKRWLILIFDTDNAIFVALVCTVTTNEEPAVVAAAAAAATAIADAADGCCGCVTVAVVVVLLTLSSF